MRDWLPILAVPLIVVAACSKPAPDGDKRPAALGEAAARTEPSMNLPRTAGEWTRADTPRRIDQKSIFSYMDGAGELYIGYRFDHLDVYEYAAPGRDPILVELYWMRTPDDAFGLLSNDWGGQAVDLQESVKPSNNEPNGTVPASRALYGAGLLRIWSDTLYARVLASRETPESQAQVIALGRAIVAGRTVAARPALLRLLPEQFAGGYRIRPDRVWFLRSHLVLNSAYFLSSQNILDLSDACEAAIAPYERTPGGDRRGQPASRLHLLVVRYPDAVTAQRALGHFYAAYFPEVPSPAAAEPFDPPGSHLRRTEHGWVASRLQARTLMLAFDAPDEAVARALVDATARTQ